MITSSRLIKSPSALVQVTLPVPKHHQVEQHMEKSCHLIHPTHWNVDFITSGDSVSKVMTNLLKLCYTNIKNGQKWGWGIVWQSKGSPGNQRWTKLPVPFILSTFSNIANDLVSISELHWWFSLCLSLTFHLLTLFLLLYLHYGELENTNVLYFQNPLLTDGPKKIPADEQQLITHPCLAGIAHP